jgi:hypothetical protein
MARRQRNHRLQRSGRFADTGIGRVVEALSRASPRRWNSGLGHRFVEAATRLPDGVPRPSPGLYRIETDDPDTTWPSTSNYRRIAPFKKSVDDLKPSLVTATYAKPGFIVPVVFCPSRESNANSTSS